MSIDNSKLERERLKRLELIEKLGLQEGVDDLSLPYIPSDSVDKSAEDKELLLEAAKCIIEGHYKRICISSFVDGGCSSKQSLALLRRSLEIYTTEYKKNEIA